MSVTSECIVFVVLLICVAAVTIIREWKGGRLNKPWYHWLIIVIAFVLPLLIFVLSFKIHRYLAPVGIAVFLLIFLSIPLRAHLLSWSTIKSGVTWEIMLRDRVPKWADKHPCYLWLRETLTTGIVAMIVTVTLWAIFRFLADIEEWQFLGKDSAGLLCTFVLGALLTIPSIIIIVTAGLLCRSNVHWYGIASGFIVSLGISVFSYWSGWAVKPVLIIGPLVGGFLSEAIVTFIRKRGLRTALQSH